MRLFFTSAMMFDHLEINFYAPTGTNLAMASFNSGANATDACDTEERKTIADAFSQVCLCKIGEFCL
jgi:hypothetical protein